MARPVNAKSQSRVRNSDFRVNKKRTDYIASILGYLIINLLSHVLEILVGDSRMILRETVKESIYRASTCTRNIKGL